MTFGKGQVLGPLESPMWMPHQRLLPVSLEDWTGLLLHNQKGFKQQDLELFVDSA